MKRIALALALLIGFQAHAERGGWVGSGGEIFRYAKNPWFVKNTKTIDYCIRVDSGSFSADPKTIREAINEAIDYWKNEFDQPLPNPPVGVAQVATQTFNEVACSANPPLQFVLGYGALTKDEIDGLTDPRKYVGVSMRTEYDNETLTGKGFVFISSDCGPHAYDSLPNASHLLPRAWKEKKLLVYALLHELGHVFGVPHTGSGVMSEVFLDQLLHKSFYEFYLNNPLQTFTTPPLTFDVCMLTGQFNATYFQIPLDTGCMRFEGTQDKSGKILWNVFSKKTAKDAAVSAGSINVSRLTQLEMASKPAVVIHLPPEQKVFTLSERFVNTFMVGPVFSEGTATGIFKTTASHRPFDLQVELRTDSIVMTGLVSGRMTPVLVYRPPSLLSMTLPVGP